jgi:EmrB/QacA subfamily drug resistance transporter
MLKSRWVALVVLCAATLMVILDGTIVTVALPTIQVSLGLTESGLSWVMDSYLIAFGGLLLFSGRLGDLIGRRRMFLAGLAVFTLGSLACGLSPDAATLIGARFVQGAGGAMTSAVTLGMIVRLFGDDEPNQRAQAIGAFSFVGAVGASAGLIIGGLLTQYATWHWIFFVNLPIGLIAGLAGWRLLAADRGTGLHNGADALGAILATTGVMLMVFAIVQHADWWTGIIAAGLIAGFVVRQITARTPLLPPRIFASRNVSGANVVQLLVIGAAMGFQVVVALYLRHVLGYQPAVTGLAIFPIAAIIAVVSLGLSARLMARHGARLVLIAGLLLITAGLVLLTRIGPHTSYTTVLLPVFVVFGIGAGFTLPAVTTLGMSGATDADAGVVSGVFNTAQQVGGALGVAIQTTLLTTSSVISGYHHAWAVGAGLSAAALVVALLVLRSRPTRETSVRPGVRAPGLTDVR